MVLDHSLQTLAHLAPGAHVCGLFGSEEAHRELFTRFLREGLEQGQKIIYIADSHSREDILDYFAGWDVGPYLAKGQFSILTPDQTYLREGSFDPDRMVDLLRAETEKALAEGYTALRVSGEMSWSLRGAPGSDRLIEYEAKLNKFFPDSQCLAICQYDKSRFGPQTLLDVLSTHPMVVLETELYDNFYYTPPEEFLARDIPELTLRYWLENLKARKGMTSQLVASEKKFRGLLEAAPDAMVIVNAQGRITFFNSQAEKVFGYKREELIGEVIERLVPERLRDGHRDKCVGYFEDPLHRLMESSQAMAARRKDGSEFPAEAVLSPIELPDGLVVSAAIRDISERIRLEEQLRQSEKIGAIGRLAGGIAHDFNNLLTIINGYSDLLLQGVEPGDPTREHLAQIKQAGDGAASLTRQLLAFSRRQVLQPQVLDLNAVVANTEKMLRRLIGEDIDLVMVRDPALGQAKADPGQIEQILINLAANARDAMPQGGKLTIETGNVELDDAYARCHATVTAGCYVMLAVSDTGIGMDAETRARIFEPFFTTKEKGMGTGLGLATVYGIVKQSGGHIWVYSEPGRGTTFKIYLSRVGEAGESVQTPEARARVAGGSETILLVEDEEAVRSLAARILQEHGYKVLESTSVEEALQIGARQEEPINLLLTDVVMPGMSGRNVAEHLGFFRPEMKVLYMSGYTDNAIVHHGVLDAGMAFLEKPFAPEALVRKVREVLDSSGPTQSHGERVLGA